MRYTMMQVCKETGMTYRALKFYCNEGLVPNVKRDKNNRRVFDERDVAWISSLTRLKKCGMSIQERCTARYRLLLAFLPYFIPAPRRAPSSG